MNLKLYVHLLETRSQYWLDASDDIRARLAQYRASMDKCHHHINLYNAHLTSITSQNLVDSMISCNRLIRTMIAEKHMRLDIDHVWIRARLTRNMAMLTLDTNIEFNHDVCNTIQIMYRSISRQYERYIDPGPPNS